MAGLQKSIEEFGDVSGLVFNTRTGHLVAGHQRLEAIKSKFGDRVRLTDVRGTPCVTIEGTTHAFPVRLVDWPLEREQLANVAANNPHIAGEFTNDLAALVEGLRATGLADLLSPLRVDDILGDIAAPSVAKAGLTDPDEVPDPPATPISKPGDLWQMGGHRLLCGDSTNHADVGRLMGGQRAALFSTDPPYLVDYDGNNHPHKWGEKSRNKDWSGSYGVTWDDANANPDLYDQFIATAVSHAIQPSAAWYCWHASRRQAMLEAIWEKHGAFVHQQIIWAKDRPILTRSWYMWQHEPCFFGWIKSKKPKRTADDHPATVWQIPTVAAGAKTDHPTSKPVEVFAIPMRQHTKPHDICYEPFSGSGSQIIAAEQLDRRCFAIEISPAYCDVAVTRWETFTGKKAKRERGGKAA